MKSSYTDVKIIESKEEELTLEMLLEEVNIILHKEVEERQESYKSKVT